MRKTNFLLGVGAQKAGTSWLHQYLKRNPNADFGFVKEYHIFDALYGDQLTQRLDRVKNNVRSILNTNIAKDSDFAQRNVKLLEFYSRPESYFEYFQYLVFRDPAISLVGDITPSYSGLSGEIFQHIRDQLLSYDFNPRVVFLMRDPVDRVCSMERFNRKNLRKLGEPITKTLDEQVCENFAKYYQRIRTTYQFTIKNIETSFPEEERLFHFYERMWDIESIEQICNFLDVPLKQPDFTKRVNASPDEEVSEETKKEVAYFYKDTYDFVSNRFGAETIENMWPNFRYIRYL